MTNKELTELMIKQLLHEWKREKSITTAYDICNTLCEYYKINERITMKLRNKKTGDVIECEEVIITKRVEDAFTNPYTKAYRAFSSIAELNEDWEDYKPTKPLIKDEKVRKAVRAWAG